MGARMTTTAPQYAPMEVVSSSEDEAKNDDAPIAAAEGSQKNSLRGIDEIGGATAGAYSPFESTASSSAAELDLDAMD